MKGRNGSFPRQICPHVTSGEKLLAPKRPPFIIEMISADPSSKVFLFKTHVVGAAVDSFESIDLIIS